MKNPVAPNEKPCRPRVAQQHRPIKTLSQPVSILPGTIPNTPARGHHTLGTTGLEPWIDHIAHPAPTGVSWWWCQGSHRPSCTYSSVPSDGGVERHLGCVCVGGERISPDKSPPRSCGILNPPTHLEGNPCLTL
jgi:hypothetical protein